MVLHYSVNFENDPFTYHGETNYPLNIYQNYEPYAESMTAFVKAALTKSIKNWGFTPDQIIKAEFYFFKLAEEIIFFEWEKDNLIENQ
jgi:hypothetical protein